MARPLALLILPQRSYTDCWSNVCFSRPAETDVQKSTLLFGQLNAAQPRLASVLPPLPSEQKLVQPLLGRSRSSDLPSVKHQRNPRPLTVRKHQPHPPRSGAFSVGHPSVSVSSVDKQPQPPSHHPSQIRSHTLSYALQFISTTSGQRQGARLAQVCQKPCPGRLETLE